MPVDPTASPDGKPRRRAARAATPAVAPEAPVPADRLQPLLAALQAAAEGDFTIRLPVDTPGIVGQLARAYNDYVDKSDRMTAELVRVSDVVGRDGRMTERAGLGHRVPGSWSVQLDAVNALIGDLVQPTTEVARVLVAVAEGDLSQKMALEIEGQPIKGEFLRIGTTVNTMVDQLSAFASEVTRVAREVGTEGVLGGQAQVPDAAGTWKDLTDSVNAMASNLTGQVRNIALVTTAVANGDLSQKITVDVRGEMLELKNTINVMVDQLGTFADEVTRMAREVGTEGVLGGQAEVRGVSGTWKDLTDSVNAMASNLTDQVRNIALVTTAVANGDLSQKITVDVRGEMLELKNTTNVMVDQLSAFASEVTRVAREVGTEGVLGGQAQVPGVSGTWKDLTDSVNGLAGNLTIQLRDMSRVSTAIASGDLRQKITVEAKGEILQIKDVINVMVDQLSTFADEVTRVAREVGTEGKLGGQAEVQGVSGTWKDLTDSVNAMGGNLTDQVRNIALVTTAVANGDLSQKITVDVKGEMLELKNTINTMVDQLSAFASEVTRVAREVGTEGVLGGQAQVPGISGTWKDLTDNVNGLAGNLTIQLRDVSKVATAIASGDLRQKITVEAKGEILQIKDVINVMVDQLSAFASEVTRVAREVGTEGVLGGQAQVPGVSGTWKDLTDSVNGLARNLTIQLRDMSRVSTAIASGDLRQKITVEAKGEILQIKDVINVMVDQLSTFADEVTRVAREVGTEGVLGGQAEVQGVSGTWKDLTDSVNAMGGNLTDQVRNIALVTTAVANGDLSQKITVDVKGELLELKNTINTMVDQLGSFAGEVTRVAREVGTEGVLGGQAEVRGVSGTWKDLTDNVNVMAGNLTGQVRGIVQVVTAVANGDLTKKLVLEAKGEIAALADTINSMTDTLNTFASEVNRVAREVGTEGKLGGQAQVPGVSGTWKDLTDNVNGLAGNLTVQLRDVSRVATAIASGDLRQKITVEAKGEILQIKDVINVMVDQLSTFAGEVTRVAKEVGTEGVLGGQAQVPGVSGTWKDLTDSVNGLAGNLTIQLRDVSKVAMAIASGDLRQKITVEAKGEILEIKDVINVMVDQLSTFADEVTRVAREVGTEGKLGGQAEVQGVSGTWKDLTDNVNYMAFNLTNQVRNIALVTTAVANGDLSQKITVDVKGELLELKNTINTMVDQLGAFAGEVTRVAREVGTEGKLGGQAEVRGVSGTWKDLTDNVNGLAGNLTIQLRDVSRVATAIASGDLRQKITVEAKGEILQIKDVINVMVDQLSTFAGEVTRVAREVGTEGVLGGQAQVPGVAGTWKDLTDSVNAMGGNLTNQVRNIALVTTAVANGDLSQKITVDVKGELLELKNTINTMVDQLRAFAGEVTRVAREVGTEGKLGGQAQVPGVSGTWKDLTDNVNVMAGNLTGQVRGIVQVVTAVANGNLTKKLVLEAKGEIAALADTINSMTDTLSTFAEQVTRVAREVGTEGKLGGQAQVPGVSGTWKDLTDNVNMMADNLTTQVRGIVQVVTSVANGDLAKKLVLEAKGEIAALADTINSMTDTLNTFASEVTRVAREVGTEGKLGGQAKVPGAAGTWRDLTDNVNFMASTLTTQVRSIAEVATAVTSGDLTRSISIDAQGEMQALRNNINQMIGNLGETTRKNAEQDWLKSNLARFSRMMQGQRSLEDVAKLIMSELTPLVGAHHGAFFMMDAANTEDPSLRLVSSYAYRERKNLSNRFHLGEGLVGQAALEKKSILITNVPHDYVQINSGLGEGTPLNIFVLPVTFEGQVKAVIELASFTLFSEIHKTFLDQLMESVGVVLNMIGANVRTEDLLKQSQLLTQELQNQSEELQTQQEELRQSNSELEAQARALKSSEELLKAQQEELRRANEELERKAAQLAEQNRKVEAKNREVEAARGALEEKAEQLSLSSKYKSEFLANMSHELRTPLNSMLILAKLLTDNKAGNLTAQQVEFFRTIHGAGNDLLNLINEILDLSKIESGKMAVNTSEFSLREVEDFAERTFRQGAQQKGVGFTIALDPSAPQTIVTDPQRLQQVLKNLLSNAFKFTEQGSVTLGVAVVPAGRINFDSPQLLRADQVVGFSVKDTGIGIAVEKQRLIFEAFQQADGTTSRKYGGTGLGLSISREIARLLGGEIRLESVEGKGSTFTLYLPRTYDGGSGTTAGPNATPAPTGDVAAPERSDTGTGQSPASSAPAPAAPAPSRGAAPVAAAESALEPVAVTSGPVPALPGGLSDDRSAIQPGDRTLLIVEDDQVFAAVLLQVARESGFKGLIALQGDTGLLMARTYTPDAIVLDLGLPVVDGWTVLDRLKHDSATRHIPVHIVSGQDKERHRALAQGAIAYLEKPVSREALDSAFDRMRTFADRGVRNLLVVEDDETQRTAIIELIGNGDVHTTAVGSGKEALEQLRSGSFDCVVMDLGLPDMSGFDLIEQVKKEPALHDIPIIIYTGRDLTKAEDRRLRKYAETIIVKDVNSPDRLLDETALFLHRVEAKLPEEKRRLLHQMHSSDAVFAGRKVLVVDDDMRNIFALTSVLESHGMQVVFAENGREALEVMDANPDLSLVLMDVMMPEMDGYEAMREIRKRPAFKKLPIISLTAKAMKGDREQSIAAGASDYITKPVDTEQLLSLMRVWLYK